MFPLGGLGRVLLLFGLVLLGLGLLFVLGEKIPWIGRLPGDIRIKGEKFGFYFPIMTCIIISLLLTLFVSLFRK